MRKIAFNLSEDSLTKAVEQMKAYKAEIHKKAQLLVERLTDYGLTICRAKVIEMNIPDTGHLLSQVDGYYSPLLNAGFIFCGCDYAVFVEFGTGVKGASQPYAGQAISECGYQYMGGTHYITTQDGRIGWFYPADDGTWKFTQGMPSRPFMYETGLEMRNTLDNIIKEVFK